MSPRSATQFLRGNGRPAGISRQSSFTERNNSRASGANSHRHVGVDEDPEGNTVGLWKPAAN
jgi:hypothetical protein